MTTPEQRLACLTQAPNFPEWPALRRLLECEEIPTSDKVVAVAEWVRTGRIRLGGTYCAALGIPEPYRDLTTDFGAGDALPLLMSVRD